MGTHISRSAEETEALGRIAGMSAQSGWVFGLSGDLGAGKTQWVRGFARGLGIADRIVSPTYTLVHEYRTGRIPLFHLDLYRLEDPEQIISAGLLDYLDPREGVSVIEWFEHWIGPRPARFQKIHITSLGESERRIEYHPAGH